MHRRHLAALLGALTLVLVPAAHGAGGGVVVSQIYASGGNTGAAYANDYVELLNTGSGAVDLTGWTLQYASSTSASWQLTPLAGSIAPGGHYLVGLASAGAVGTALPPADASGTANLAAAGGKVALVHDATALTCGLTSGSCAGSAGVADFVGWGTASDYEGAAAAPALSATTAAVRADGGCTDTDANGADFALATPTPHDSASPATTCTTAAAPGVGTADAAVVADVSPLLSIALDRPSISLGALVPGDTPAPVSESVTVVSNDSAGYALTVHRTAFSPADLPLGIAVAPSPTLVGVPLPPAADLVVGGTSAPTPATGDVWPLLVGLTAAVPPLGSGRYTATVTFTVIAK